MAKFAGVILGAVEIGVGLALQAGPGTSALGAFLVKSGILTVVSSTAQLLLAPGMKARQGTATSLQLGEVPRQGVFGEGATAGSLVDVFNYGGKYGTDWTVMVVALADHRCQSLSGFWVQGKYHAFTGDGMVAGFNDQLQVAFRPGAWDDSVPDWVLDNAPTVAGTKTWTAADRGRGVAKVFVAYKADKEGAKNPIWSEGPPYGSFLWVLKGALIYSARDDSSVGGEGAHRWSDPTTREWSANLIDCRYTWARGFYAGDKVDEPGMLLLGRGLSAVEQPPENVFAPANLCDEDVPTIGDGSEKRYTIGDGSEKRYTIGGVFGGDDAYIDTEEDFAAACGGWLVEREGAVELVPGAAQPIVATITDADFLEGGTITASDFPSETDESFVNTVAGKYVEPKQQWADHSAPVRRVDAYVIADGGPRVAQPSLALVTSIYQAQRVCEMTLRQGRLWRQRGLPLPPRLIGLEHGDWVELISNRYGPRGAFLGDEGGGDIAGEDGGVLLLEAQPVIYQVVSDAQDEGWKNTLSLKEVSAGIYDPPTLFADGAIAVQTVPAPVSDAPGAGSWVLATATNPPRLVITGAVDDDYASAVLIEVQAGASSLDIALEDGSGVIAAEGGSSEWVTAAQGDRDATRFEIAVAIDVPYAGRVRYLVRGIATDPLALGTVAIASAGVAPGIPRVSASDGVGSASVSIRAPQTPFDHLSVLRGAGADPATMTVIAANVIAGLGQQVTLSDAPGAGAWWYSGIAYAADGTPSAPADPVRAVVS